MNALKAMKMTITEAINLIGLSREEITEYTYIYLDEDGDLCAIEKQDRGADPTDEVFRFGYVTAHEEYALLSVQEVAAMKGVSAQAVRDVLRDDSRRAVIFPNARRFGTVERGGWRIPFADASAWTPKQK
jgi:hypothetical protein